jgi:peptidoglycan L-alanyl-D-glutamate endopeptidase CwlK
MSSRSLLDLVPPVRDRANKFLADCHTAGIDVLIYCTYRSPAEQNELYKIGRSLPGKIATNARGGQSWHNFHAAFDFVPMIGGKPQFNNKTLYAKCGAIAESVGLEWAGRWAGSLKETAHCQYRGGLTLAQASSGETII